MGSNGPSEVATSREFRDRSVTSPPGLENSQDENWSNVVNVLYHVCGADTSGSRATAYIEPRRTAAAAYCPAVSAVPYRK